MEKTATKYGELYESLEGLAKGEFKCDSCGVAIDPGDITYAAVMLTSVMHPNYEMQHPQSWSHNYINPIKS